MLKKKSIYTKYLYLLSQKIFFPGLRSFGAQVRYPQNQYNTVQIDLKYPFVSEIITGDDWMASNDLQNTSILGGISIGIS